MPNFARDTLTARPVLSLVPLLACLGLSLGSPALWAEGFIDDSHGTLTLRNYYMDRDYKDDGAKTAATRIFLRPMRSAIQPPKNAPGNSPMIPALNTQPIIFGSRANVCRSPAAAVPAD